MGYEISVDSAVEDATIQFTNTYTPTTISFMSRNNEPMLQISDKDFWVRGVKVEQGPGEAEEVYEGFKQWLTWVTLTRKD